MKYTNEWFIDLILKYGIAMLVGFLLILTVPSFIIGKIKSTHNALATTCSLEELSVGTKASFYGKTLVVTDSVFYESLGRGQINVSEI